MEIIIIVAMSQNRVIGRGTTHARLCATDKIDGPLAVINADDFYRTTKVI